MKKLKALLAAALACVFALSLAGCTPEQSEEPAADELVLSLVEVDTTNAKTEFFVGEQFSTEGLVVTRSGRNLTQETVFYQEEVPLDECTIDSSAFKSDTVGEYVITVSYTLGEVTKSDEYTVSVVRPVRPYRLILDESGAKKMFGIGEEFSSDGLKATAFDYDYSAQKELEPYDVTASIAVDSSAYNAEVAGSYEIVVSYTKDETTIQASYNVSVKVGAGLEIVLPEDAVVDANGAMSVDLQKGGTTVDFGDWVVNQVNANGGVDKVVTEDITFEVYNAATPVAVNGTSFTATEGGAYNVWAVLEGYQLPDSEETFTLKSFVIIYVMDSLKSITFNADASGTLVTQPAGSDIISKTWTFTATYSSGATKQLTAEDVVIEGLTTTAVTAAGVANISYTEPNAKGDSMSANTTVNYTITEAVGGDGVTVIIGSEEISALSSTITAETKINDYISITASADKSVSVDSNSKTYEDKSFTHRIKLGGEGTNVQRSLKLITAEDNARIIIYAMSSSSSESRTAALYDGTFVDKNSTPEAVVGNTINVPGDKLNKYEFTVEEAGTYYFASQSGGLNVYGVEIYNPAPAAPAGNISIGSEEISALSSTITAETKINDYISITASADKSVSVDSNSKTYEDKSFTHRIKLGGEGTNVQRSLKLITAEDNARIIIYAMSSSSSESRTAALYDGTFVDKNSTPEAVVGNTINVPGDKLNKYEFTVEEAGTYYFASQSGGLNVYGIEIVYN